MIGNVVAAIISLSGAIVFAAIIIKYGLPLSGNAAMIVMGVFSMAVWLVGGVIAATGTFK